MTRVEQHKMIEALCEYQHRMKGRDADEFEMFHKRDRDDEELDEAARRRLVELYTTYVPERFR